MEIGRINLLTVVQRQGAAVYLDGGVHGRLLLPARSVADTVVPGDALEVFVYRGGDDALVATTQIPLAQVGDIAYLKVVAKHAAGAFLDWGLPKDLLVPFNEQRHELELGHSYLVKVFDSPKGIAATTYFEDYLSYEAFYFKPGQTVSLLIAETTELGVKAIVDHTHWGLLYKNEIFQPLKIGQRIKGYVKQIRADRRLDLSLYSPGYAKVTGLTGQILAKLQQAGHYLPLSDSSSPEAIYAQFGVSKKAFKQAIGALYKQRLINIEKQGIRLLDKAVKAGRGE